MTARVDFLRPEAPPRLGWLLLAVGVGALISAFAFDSAVEAAAVEARRSVQVRLDQEREALRPPRVLPPSPAQVRARQTALDSRAPWLATLRTIEAASQDPVYLRSLVIEPATGAVKLEAEATSFAEALAFAEVLDGEGALRPALISSHEQVVDPATSKEIIRFSLAGRWNSR